MAQHFFAHPTADVSPQASIGADTRIWQQCQVREGAVVGRNCTLSKGVYVDAGVHIGDNVKIQNGVSIYQGVTLEDGVFCGPHCVFTNDRQPRAVNPDGTLKSAGQWAVGRTLVRMGASIGAQATIVCGVTIGRWAMVGAGAVVTRDVPDHGLVYGNPARLHGFVCPCGGELAVAMASPGGSGDQVSMACRSCGAEALIPQSDYTRLAQAGRRS
jgi:acetyltransferase-like isoleucine patch superfamily enzyme